MMLPQFPDNPFQIRLSFHKIIDRLESEAQLGDHTAGMLLNEIDRYPEFRNGITHVGQIENNADLIARLLSDLFPAALTGNEIKAVSIPYQGLMFNYTQRFSHILKSAGEDFEINIRNFDDHQFYVFSCCLILRHFYGTDVDFSKPLFFDIPTTAGYTKHYRILYNADYIEIIPIVTPPQLSAADLEELLNNYDNLELWKVKFPKENWLMKGFALITLVDVTVENAVSLLKGNLLGNGDDPDLDLKMASAFQSIFQLPMVRVGFTSMDELDGRFPNITFGHKVQSLLLSGNDLETVDLIFKRSLDKWSKNQTYYAISDVRLSADQELPGPVINNFLGMEIESLILAPVVKDHVVLGFLELASPHRNDFNSVNANKLENVMPFLIDTIDRKITEFKNRIQAVIQSNYTTLHPSVNWKFEREAYNFIRTIDAGMDYNLGEIKFQDVYPLYGEVDVQNSSVTHNLSIRQDLEVQVNDLMGILNKLTISGAEQRVSKVITRLQEISAVIHNDLKADSEQYIEYFLETEVHPLLLGVQHQPAELTAAIGTYFSGTNKINGEYNLNRRNYGKTINIINDVVISILDKRHEEVQKYFPHYYERFKTDGVEHNLYIGESIHPSDHFGAPELERLRLWQLLVTAEMEIAQRHIQQELPYPLGLTSLILVFSTPINIRFRMDEKHFDLDGDGDVKYEVIKKRIDKARIKGTNRRITARERLTIVFMQEEERRLYEKYVRILQSGGILGTDVEVFEVEDLQGVSGLKALSVSIAPVPDEIVSFDDFYEIAYAQLNSQGLS